MNIFQFMSASPLLTFFLLCVLALSICKCWQLLLRYLIIRKHGYPPPHVSDNLFHDGYQNQVEE